MVSRWSVSLEVRERVGGGVFVSKQGSGVLRGFH